MMVRAGALLVPQSVMAAMRLLVRGSYVGDESSPSGRQLAGTCVLWSGHARSLGAH